MAGDAIHLEKETFAVTGEAIWKALVNKEKAITAEWPVKWNWILDEYKMMAEKLNELKQFRPMTSRQKTKDTRSCKPIPITSSRMIGWLAGRPEFALEIYGPYVKKFPKIPESAADFIE